MAPDTLQPIRRVVTGNDAAGRSCVTWDGFAPSVHPMWKGNYRGHTDLWVWDETPVPLTGEDDGGRPYHFPGAPNGGHLRVVESEGRPADYDAASDPSVVPPHAPREVATGRRWNRGGKCLHTGDMHKTETVDYAILLQGERNLILDDVGEVTWNRGDVVIQVGAWHQWTSPGERSLAMFDMIGARFVDGPVGLGQGNDPPLQPPPGFRWPEGVKPTRRIVTIDREPGRGTLVSDGPCPDVRLDPARPGFASARLWVTDGTPARIVFETLHLPHTLEPPPSGSVLRVVTYPPDASWSRDVGPKEVAAYFSAMGSPRASTGSPEAPHPYMQKTGALDFCCVLEGELTLVLDTGRVVLRAGEFAIVRGSNHAWSNHTDRPAVVAIASHDAVDRGMSS